MLNLADIRQEYMRAGLDERDVLAGEGGDLILSTATEVLRAEFPEVAERIRYHIPDEKEKRHGQAIAAASLPSIPTLETR